MAKDAKEFWGKQFAQISTLTGQELIKLDTKLTEVRTLSNNVFSEKFVKAFQELLDSAHGMGQILGVIQFTRRWQRGRPNKTRQGEGTETETD
jgi:hypothetical protein